MATDQKDRQVWATEEVVSTGGFMAVLGKLAGKTGLTNTGIVAAAAGLAVNGFYAPGTTKVAHLKAEIMWSCMSRELAFISGADRILVMTTADAKGKAEAETAVHDAVEQTDDAIGRYRAAILNQQINVPSQQDLARFHAQYTQGTSNSMSIESDPRNQVDPSRRVSMG